MLCGRGGDIHYGVGRKAGDASVRNQVVIGILKVSASFFALRVRLNSLEGESDEARNLPVVYVHQSLRLDIALNQRRRLL